METTDILSKEHEIIKTMIIKTIEMLDSDNVISEEDFFSSYDFFTKYADNFHHKKEEDIYFKWMIEKKPDLQLGPIRVMLNDHDHMRELIKNAKEFYLKNDETQYRANFKNYCRQLREHINKEDQVLYNIAEDINKNSLDGDELMLTKFNKIIQDDVQLNNKWKNISIHPDVKIESKIQNEKNTKSNCCGSCH